MRSITEQGHTFEEWLTPEQIAAAIQPIADRINAEYKDKSPLFVVVLNGAFVFASDLIRRVNVHCEVTFIRVKSYEGMNSAGEVQMIVPLQHSVKDRDVIVIEDIVDTGLTMHWLKAHLREQGAASVRVAALLCKPDKIQFPDARPDYVARNITNEFVIGYGLDLDGFVRNLDAIYKIKE